MIVQPLHDAPLPELAQALEHFERQFSYPLGPGRSFRISHGDDYPRFFRAIGDAACFVAMREAKVLGVIGAALRSVRLPGGADCSAVYLGDLKIDPSVRGGRTLPALASAVQQWVDGRIQAAFSVVMDGTPVTPTRYTGRLGIPAFQELGKIIILRLAVPAALDPEPRWHTTAALGSACYLRLSAGRYACPGGFPAERSAIEPRWLMAPDASACARLEDTRRAKRLIADDGIEMQSAHLSSFAYEDVPAGVALVDVALKHTAQLGLPALFVAVPTPDADAFYQQLHGTEIVTAPATVFGAGFQAKALWNINTAEI